MAIRAKDLTNVRTLDSLVNMIPSFNQHNNNMEITGNEVYNVNYNDKYNAFKNLNIVYEKAKPIQDSNLENPDILAKDLFKGGWEGAAAGILDIDNMLDAIEEGEAYKFRYASDGKYSQRSLKKALEQRRNAYTAVVEVLDDPDNSESFMVINPDGSMDDDTALLLDKLKFNIVTGDVQEVNSTINTGTTKAIQDYNFWDKSWVKWKNLNNKALTGSVKASDLGDGNEEILSILSGQGLDESSPLEQEFITRMMATSSENADKANRRHRVFTGQLYNKTPVWKVYEYPEDLSELGMSDNQVNINDLNNEDIYGVSEATEEDLSMGISPVEKIKEESPMSKSDPQVGSLRYKESKLKREEYPKATEEISEEEKIKQEYNLYIADMEKPDMSYKEFKNSYKEQEKYDTMEYEYQGHDRGPDAKPFLLKDEYDFVDKYKLQNIPHVGYFLSEDGTRLSINELSKKDPGLLRQRLNDVIKDKRFYRGIAYGQRAGMRLRKDIGVINNLIKQYNLGKKKDIGGYNIEERIMKYYNRIMDNFMGYARDVGFNEIQKTRGLLLK